MTRPIVAPYTQSSPFLILCSIVGAWNLVFDLYYNEATHSPLLSMGSLYDLGTASFSNKQRSSLERNARSP